MSLVHVNLYGDATDFAYDLEQYLVENLSVPVTLFQVISCVVSEGDRERAEETVVVNPSRTLR